MKKQQKEIPHLSVKDGNKGMETLANDETRLPDSKYIRVDTRYFLNEEMPVWDSHELRYERQLTPWSKEAIKEDSNDRNFLADIPRYRGFITLPSHTNYQEVVRGQFVNRYKRIPAQPQEGSFDKTMEFLNHIFGRQLYLGLDYLQLLYLKPLQILPVLLLVSDERNTGKTTFLKFLRLLFGENVTLNHNDEFQDRFNSSWTNKLLICVDEVLLKTEKAAQYVKYLSTTDSFKTESKGVDKKEDHFFGKFVMTSNNEENPIYIEPGEIRYWVRKVPPLNTHNPFLLDELKRETPAFLHFLLHRTMATAGTPRDRAWFWAKEIETEALKKMKTCHTSPLQQKIKSILEEIMEREDAQKVQFTLGDMVRFMQDYGGKTDKGEIRGILNRLGFFVGENTTYNAYLYYDNQTGRYYREQRKDRFYTITKNDLNQKF